MPHDPAVGAAPRGTSVSVVIPTVGRPDLLASALRSVLACDPGASEVIVVDQDRGTATADLVARCADSRVRRVECDGRGAGRARNRGVRAATGDVVMFTDDDCRVAPDWIGVALSHLGTPPCGIVTGKVLPGDGGAGHVPSTITAGAPRDWTGVQSRGALYTGNMAAPRAALASAGPFDERPSLRFAAEDNDLCFRWIRDGGRLRYVPDMVVWHEDWRSPDDTASVYARYARGQGAFYAKHMVRRDPVITRFFLEDLRRGVRAAGWRRRRSVVDEQTRSRLPWMLVGVTHGVFDALVSPWRRGRP